MRELTIEDLKPMLREMTRRARRRSPTGIEAVRKRHEEFVRELKAVYLHSLARQGGAEPNVSGPVKIPRPPDVGT